MSYRRLGLGVLVLLVLGQVMALRGFPLWLDSPVRSNVSSIAQVSDDVVGSLDDHANDRSS